LPTYYEVVRHRQPNVLLGKSLKMHYLSWENPWNFNCGKLWKTALRCLLKPCIWLNSALFDYHMCHECDCAESSAVPVCEDTISSNLCTSLSKWKNKALTSRFTTVCWNYFISKICHCC